MSVSRELVYERMVMALDLEEAGRKVKEIAEQMGISVTTARRYLQRGKDNKEMVVQRERRVWMMRQAGHTHQEIADELGVSRSTVTMMLGRLSRRFRENHAAEIEREKFDQYIVLQGIFSEAMKAWEKSKQPAKKVVREQYSKPGRSQISPTGQVVSEAGIAEETLTTSVEESAGDKGYLTEARAALKDIRELFGLDAPQKISVDWKSEVLNAGIDPMAFLERLSQEAYQMLEAEDVAYRDSAPSKPGN